MVHREWDIQTERIEEEDKYESRAGQTEQSNKEQIIR